MTRDNRKLISLRVSPKALDRVDRIAKHLGDEATRSSVLRTALGIGVAHLEESIEAQSNISKGIKIK